MPTDPDPVRARRWTALAILLILVTVPAVPMLATAQVGVYTVEGSVTTPEGEPAASATVRLAPENASEDARTTTADADGRYQFRNVEEDSYDLTATHDCCGPAARTITVEGMQLTHEHALELAPANEGAGSLVLHGRTFDHGTDDPVPGVDLVVENRWDSQDGSDDGHRTVRLTSSPNGSYAVQVHPGDIEIRADTTGYGETFGFFPIDEDRTVDVPMVATDDHGATVTGQLRSTNGTPIADGRVSAEPDHRRGCDDGPCAASAPVPDPDSRRIEEDGVSFRVETRTPRYASITTDADGRWQLSIREGPIRIQAWAHDHVGTDRTLQAEAGRTHTVNLTVTPIPPDSVRWTGQVTDAETGEAIEQALVTVETPRWGERNATRTDEQGRYEITAKPGYTIVTARAQERYATECEVHHGSTPSSQGASARDGEGQGDEEVREASATRPQPEPERCQVHEREHAYHPRSATLVTEANTTTERSFDLERAPEPDATLRGWIVNASSQEGVPDVDVRVRNEDTNDWGRATTDANGSFTLDVRAGYHTLETWARGYFRAVENVDVEPGETVEVAIEVTPGEPRYRWGCCVAVAASMDAAHGGQAPARANTSTTANAPAPEGASGEATYAGGPGHLGPYDPAAVGSTGADGDGPRAAPGPTALELVAPLAAIAVAWRRRPRVR